MLGLMTQHPDLGFPAGEEREANLIVPGLMLGQRNEFVPSLIFMFV